MIIPLVYWCINKKAGFFLMTNVSFRQVIIQTVKNVFCTYHPWIRDARIIPAQKPGLPQSLKSNISQMAGWVRKQEDRHFGLPAIFQPTWDGAQILWQLEKMVSALPRKPKWHFQAHGRRRKQWLELDVRLSLRPGGGKKAGYTAPK